MCGCWVKKHGGHTGTSHWCHGMPPRRPIRTKHLLIFLRLCGICGWWCWEQAGGRYASYRHQWCKLDFQLDVSRKDWQFTWPNLTNAKSFGPKLRGRVTGHKVSMDGHIPQEHHHRFTGKKSNIPEASNTTVPAPKKLHETTNISWQWLGVPGNRTRTHGRSPGRAAGRARSGGALGGRWPCTSRCLATRYLGGEDREAYMCHHVPSQSHSWLLVSGCWLYFLGVPPILDDIQRTSNQHRGWVHQHITYQKRIPKRSVDDSEPR